MANTIDDLREHLFDTLTRLKDKSNPLDIDRAKAVCEVAGRIIESAKVEVSHLNVVGGLGSGFIPQRAALGPKPEAGARTELPARLVNPGTRGASK